MMNIFKEKKYKNILVLGAGGSGMNVVCQYLVSNGIIVYASDRGFDQDKKTRIKNILSSKGVKIINEKNNISDKKIDLLIITPAVENEHNSILQAKELGIPVIKRTEFLLDVFNSSNGIAIAGTSGKTTITGMTATILHENNLNYTTICGDEILNFSDDSNLGNFIPGDRDKILLELDESDGSLPLYKPGIASLSTLEKDHYKLSELESMFNVFCGNTKKIIINIDNPNLFKFYTSYKSKCVSVSTLNKNADLFGEITEVSGNRIYFHINGKKGVLNISGMYNVNNALCAAAVSGEAGVSLDKSLESLSYFKGVRNRFETLEIDNKFIILDFAHNPEKIKASLISAQNLSKPVTYIFQPHGYGPLKFMLDEFASAFNDCLRTQDTLILLKVFDAGGTADRTIQSNNLLEKINHDNVLYIEDKNELNVYFKKNNSKSITWVIAGARDESLRDIQKEFYKIAQGNIG